MVFYQQKQARPTHNLSQFDNIPKNIKAESKCYLIANEWWLNFNFFHELGKENPEYLTSNAAGPINNLSLVNLSYEYQKLIRSNDNQPIDGTKLCLLKEWDKMSLIKGITYDKDFIVVSQKIWNYLYAIFGGGPIIELIPERFIEGETYTNYISLTEDPNIDNDIIISLDMIRIIFQHHNNNKLVYHVSTTQTMESIFHRICYDIQVDMNMSKLCEVIDNVCIDIVDMKQTLKTLGISNGTIFTISTTSLIKPTYNKQENGLKNDKKIHKDNENEDKTRFMLNKEGSNKHDRKTENKKNKEDSTQDQLHDLPSNYVNIIDLNQETSFSDTLSPKTASTGWKSKRSISSIKSIGLSDGNESHIYESIIIEQDDHNMKPPSPMKIEIPEIQKEKMHNEIMNLSKKAKDTLHTDRIKLKAKSLKEIKSNIMNIQSKWSTYTKSIVNKKKTSLYQTNTLLCLNTRGKCEFVGINQSMIGVMDSEEVKLKLERESII